MSAELRCRLRSNRPDRSTCSQGPPHRAENGRCSERILGHTLRGVRGTYDRHSYLNEKAHALEALAAQLRLITDPPKGNVRQLRRV